MTNRRRNYARSVIDVPETCKRLGNIHRNHLDELCRQGKLMKYKHGRRTVFDEDEVQDYIDTHIFKSV